MRVNLPGFRNSMRRTGRAVLLATTALSLAAARGQVAEAQRGGGLGGGAPEHSWPFWGGNLENTHSAFGEDRINIGNVSGLQQKWVFQTAGDVTGDADGKRRLSVCAGLGRLHLSHRCQDGKSDLEP